MHCAYHTWDLSPFPSLFPDLPDGKIPPLFCLSIGGRDGVAWLDCLDLHSAPYSEEPKIDWTPAVLLHWRKPAPFPFTHSVAVKQILENTCSARCTLNSKNVCDWVFFTLAVTAMNYLASAASAYTGDRRIFEKDQSAADNLKGWPKPHLVQKYASTSLLSQRVTQYLTEYVTARNHKRE